MNCDKMNIASKFESHTVYTSRKLAHAINRIFFFFFFFFFSAVKFEKKSLDLFFIFNMFTQNIDCG